MVDEYILKHLQDVIDAIEELEEIPQLKKDIIEIMSDC